MEKYGVSLVVSMVFLWISHYMMGTEAIETWWKNGVILPGGNWDWTVGNSREHSDMRRSNWEFEQKQLKLVGGLEQGIIILTDFHIFQRGRYTTNQKIRELSSIKTLGTEPSTKKIKNLSNHEEKRVISAWKTWNFTKTDLDFGYPWLHLIIWVISWE